jgi:TonB family protein
VAVTGYCVTVAALIFCSLMRRFLPFLLVIGPSLVAQEPSDQRAYKIGGGVSPPRITYKVEPEYSEEARSAGFQGAVVLDIVVGADGKARDIRVVRPLGLGLDQKAIEAIQKWIFDPGKKGGEPVPVIARVEVNFRLLPLPTDVPLLEMRPGSYEISTSKSWDGPITTSEIANTLGSEAYGRFTADEIALLNKSTGEHNETTKTQTSCVTRDGLNREYYITPSRASCQRVIVSSSTSQREIRETCATPEYSGDLTVDFEATGLDSYKASRQASLRRGGVTTRLLIEVTAKWVAEACNPK